MFDLIPSDPPAGGALVPAEIEAAHSYAEAEKAASTRVGYSADWDKFRAWRARGVPSLPAELGPDLINRSRIARTDEQTMLAAINRMATPRTQFGAPPRDPFGQRKLACAAPDDFMLAGVHRAEQYFHVLGHYQREHWGVTA